MRRRGRDEIRRWRLVLVALLGNAARLLVAGYVVATVWLLVTSGFEGWW